MFSSTELIEALNRRMRRSLRPLPEPGQFPPGWQEWLAAIRERIGAITGASSDAIIALLLQREPALPLPRVAQLTQWQAFATLWRQQWQPPEPEGRRERIAAYVITVVVHLLFAVLLLWLSYARMGGLPAPAGEEIVQVEYIGKGTPQDDGGGAPAGAVPDPTNAAPTKPAPAQAAAESTPQATAPTRAALTQLPPPSQPQLAQTQPVPPQPAPPSVPRAQPLEVTQTAQPDSSFVLAPVTPRTIAVPQPQVAVPELRESAEALEAVELPTPAPVEQIKPRLPAAQVRVPDLQVPTESLPQPQSSLQAVRPREVDTAQARIQAPALNAAVAALPMPDRTSSEAGQAAASDGSSKSIADTTQTGTTGNVPGATAPLSGGPPAAASGTASSPTSAGADPRNAANPGALSTPRRGDDWGLSDRNQPGGQAGKPGLFDENGRPRLPPGASAATGGGLSPGTIEENIDNLDRAGTWLKRPPIDYTPTRFDRFWIPGGTLLEEWVRRGVRAVSIPIPGTSKKLNCVVSILQLGGGCGIDDPNMQDQEAAARPPPDIPFKPELQEDQGALQQPAVSP